MWLKVKQWLWDIKFHVYGLEIPLLVVIMVILFVIGYQIVQSRLNQGKWETLKSEELGYKIEYPVGWSAETFREGYEEGHRGLPKGIRAFFNHEFFLSINRKTAALYWLPMANLEESLEWGAKTIEVDRTRNGVSQKSRVGIGQYPALTRSYPVGARGRLKAVYIPVDRGVFILEFWASNYDEYDEAIFEHMLTSFEILS